MKRLIVKFIGIICIIAGLVVVSITLYLHLDYESKMKELLNNRVILSDSQTSTSEQSMNNSVTIESDIEDFAIEELTEDQRIAEIKRGTPVIDIKSLNITVPVVNGTDKYSLKLGAGKFDHSVNMGEVGNFAVAGHSSTIYNCIFNNLESIQLLDEIDCYNEQGVLFKYYVIDKFKTTPDNIGVTFSSSQSTMTIVTCTDNGVNRFVVSAKLMSDDEISRYKRNLKQIIIERVINISDSYSNVDILSYLNSNTFFSKIPYRIKYCKVDDVDTFFSNYTVFKDKLKVKKHDLDMVFNHIIGVDFSTILMEVSKK